jgi:hypothetical protein
VLTVLAVIGAGIAFVQRQEAVDQRKEAQEQKAQALKGFREATRRVPLRLRTLGAG